jgi:hypothetical protein
MPHTFLSARDTYSGPYRVLSFNEKENKLINYRVFPPLTIPQIFIEKSVLHNHRFQLTVARRYSRGKI